MSVPWLADGGGLAPLAQQLWVFAAVLFVDALAIPLASSLYVAALGAVHPPLLVAAVGALATTAGSLAQYCVVRWLLARNARLPAPLERLRVRLTRAVEAAPEATTAALFVVYATPLSAGPLRLIAAAAGFPLWRFALAIGLGCLPYYFVLAELGRALHLPLWVYLVAVAGLAAFVLWQILRRRRAGG